MNMRFALLFLALAVEFSAAALSFAPNSSISIPSSGVERVDKLNSEWTESISLRNASLALLKLFDSTSGGTRWVRKSPGWADDPDLCVCEWFGVRCTTASASAYSEFGDCDAGSLRVSGCANDTATVIAVSLPNNGLYGYLPDDVMMWRSLSTLRTLDLSGNNLSIRESSRVDIGTRAEVAGLPKALRELSALQSFRCTSCKLGGSLPPLLFERGGMCELRELLLYDNALTAEVPNLSALRSLVTLNLAHNEFTSALPRMPASLTYLNMQHNHLSSSREKESCVETLSHLPNVSFALLANNELACNVSLLALLDCSPGSLSQRGRTLKFVDISHNRFFGHIPAVVTSCRALNVLDLSYNRIEGTIPAGLENLWLDPPADVQKSVQVFLDGNQLSGRIPEWQPRGLSNVGQLSFTNNDELRNQKVAGVAPLPSCFAADYSKPEFMPGDFACPAIVPAITNSRLKIELSPTYYNFSMCSCSLGTLGVPPFCSRCSTIPSLDSSGGVNSCFGSGLVLERGFFPFLPSTFQDDRASSRVEWISSLVLVRCPSVGFGKVACNSGGTCRVFPPMENVLQITNCSSGRSDSSDASWPTDALCAPGYSDFLCSRCRCDGPLQGFGSANSDCYYRTGDRCVPCELPPYGIFVFCLCVAFALLIFVNFLHFAGFLVSIEIVVLCVVIAIAPDTWWLLDILIGILIMQFVTRSTEHRDEAAQRAKLKLSGLFKSIIFFVQTTATLNANLWPEAFLETFGEQMDIANLNFRGLECLWPELFSSPIIQLVFNMVMPISLLTVALLVFSVVWFVQWARDMILFHLCSPADLRKRPESWRRFAIRCGRATLFLLYVSYFNMVNKILAVFNCETAGPRSFVASMPWIRCSSDSEWTNLRALASVFTVTHVLGIPVLFTILLVLRERSHSQEARARPSVQADEDIAGLVIGSRTKPPRSASSLTHLQTLNELLIFLTENYAEDGWWFDIIFILRRLALSALIFAVPHSTGSAYQVSGVSLVILLSCCFQIAVQPLKSGVHNVLELMSLIVIGVTYTALLGIRYSGNEPVEIIWIVFLLNLSILVAFAIAVSIAARYWQHLLNSIRAARELRQLQWHTFFRSGGVGIISERADMSVTMFGGEDDDDAGGDDDTDDFDLDETNARANFATVDQHSYDRTKDTGLTRDPASQRSHDRVPLLSTRRG